VRKEFLRIVVLGKQGGGGWGNLGAGAGGGGKGVTHRRQVNKGRCGEKKKPIPTKVKKHSGGGGGNQGKTNSGREVQGHSKDRGEKARLQGGGG